MAKSEPGANGSPSSARTELELPLFALPGRHPCHACGDCCQYVAVEIDKPTTNREYDNIIWYLSHGDVSVYQDWEFAWCIEFRTRCRNLTEEATCSIYRERPLICSEFSWQDCERNSGEPAARYRFEKPSEFLDWLRSQRPKAFARYMKFRADLTARREQAAKRTGAGPARPKSPRAATRRRARTRARS